jgi:branched-chain amino acid transport system permease protein
MDFFVQLFLSGICVGAVYGLGAVGFVIIYKSSGTFNLAHGEMMMIGAFFAVTLANMLGWPMWLGFLLAMIFAGVTGYIIEFSIIRPLIGQPPFAIVMVTVGLMFIIRGVCLLLWSYRSYSYPEQIFPMGSLEIGEVILSSDYISSLIIGTIFFIALGCYFAFTRSGLSMRATADDEYLAESMGVRVSRIFGMAWIMAGASAAIGGMTLGMMTSIDYMLGEVGLKVLPVVVFGGLDSVLGAIIGGIIVGVTSTLSGGYLEEYLIGFRDIAPYIIMLLVLFIRPYGLFGEKRIERI